MPEKRKREAKSSPSKTTSPRAGTRKKSARTASGKKASPQVLATASLGAQEGYRERTEAGHRAAGRTPPSERREGRSSGATRRVVDTVRKAITIPTHAEALEHETAAQVWSTERPKFREGLAAMEAAIAAKASAST